MQGEDAVFLFDPEISFALVRQKPHHADHLLGQKPQFQRASRTEVPEPRGSLRLIERVVEAEAFVCDVDGVRSHRTASRM